MAGKTQKWSSAVWMPMLAVLAVTALAQSQTSRTNDVRTETSWYDPPHQMQKKMVIHWSEEKPLPTGGNLLIKGLLVDTYQETGEPGLVMEAPDCVYNHGEQAGSSPGPLKIRTADGTSFIEGTGYLWNYKGSNLTVAISNNVATTLKRDFLTRGTNSPINSAFATNQFVYIHADRVDLDRAKNLITYTGHVHAEDERWDLTCGILTIRGAANGEIIQSPNMVAGGKISELVADQNVVVHDKAAGSRATGDRAVYRVVGGAAEVALTGSPRWESGPSTATAREFIFEGSDNTLHAIGNAHFILPSHSIGKAGFVLTSQPAGGTKALNTNVSLMDITAGAITLELPPTNGAPLRGVIAETNVVMTDVDNESRAAADRAVYSQSNGLTVLTGNASWQMRRRLARGGLLTFNQTDNTFSARTNAYLQFPPNEFGQTNLAGGLVSTNTTRTTNQLIKVSSDSYEYRNEALTFSNDVRGAFLEDDVVRDTLESGVLTIDFLNTNIVRDIVAGGGARLRQLPVPDLAGQTDEGDFQGDSFQIQMRTNGLIGLFTATGGVTASRTEISTNKSKSLLPGLPAAGTDANSLLHTNHTTFAADKLTASFLPDTNKVDVFTGEGKVRMTRDDYIARGGKVVYTATNDTVVMTEDPRLETAGLLYTADEMISYDRATGEIKATRHNHIAYLLPDVVMNKINQAALNEPKSKSK